MKKLLFRLLCYLGNVEVEQVKKKALQITFLPENQEVLDRMLERMEELRRLHEEYGMASTDEDIVRNAIGMYDLIIHDEVKEGKKFFQQVDGEMIPLRFFLVDLE